MEGVSYKQNHIHTRQEADECLVALEAQYFSNVHGPLNQLHGSYENQYLFHPVDSEGRRVMQERIASKLPLFVEVKREEAEAA